jgi:arsenate reductase (thioredoxin)
MTRTVPSTCPGGDYLALADDLAYTYQGVFTVLAERGITLTEAYPKPLTSGVVHAADVIVTMGCGDACPIYPGKRYLDGDVPDPNGQPLDTVRDSRDDLQARVTTLFRDLGI